MIQHLTLRVCKLFALLVALTFTINCTANYNPMRVSFQSQGDTISGVLNAPAEHVANLRTLLIFVHGDGAMPADAHGYYQVLWNRLADAGITTLAWDKKGVGHSDGDWLAQSMDDRAQEVLDALEHINQTYPGKFATIGLIGFSQAGWVLPEVVYRTSVPDFMIIVSGAINWQRQGQYLTRQRLTLAGASAAEIKVQAQRQAREQFLFDPGIRYADYANTLLNRCKQPNDACEKPIPEARFGFAKRNRMADATQRLEQVTVPTLALFGDHDRNVDYQESFNSYRRALTQGPARGSLVKLYPDATHGLLNASDFDTVNPDWWTLVKLAWQGEDAFADGVLDDIVAFASRESTHQSDASP